MSLFSFKLVSRLAILCYSSLTYLSSCFASRPGLAAISKTPEESTLSPRFTIGDDSKCGFTAVIDVLATYGDGDRYE